MDRPIGAVLDSILPHVEELIVVRGVGGVWQRWAAARRASGEEIYTQDDDAIVDVPAVLAAYDSDRVVCNMPADRRPEYRDGVALVGWGCVFPRRLRYDAFARYSDRFSMDHIFRRECDRVFTGLSPLKLIDVPFTHLPHAHGNDRMGREARHGADLAEIRRRIYSVRQGEPSKV